MLLVTGKSGERHGYSDEWTDEGVFLYTGEGQRGDMKFVGGNRAIRDHIKNGKTLHVFEQDKKDKRVSGWKKAMSPAERAEFFRFAGDTLQELGYEL